MPGSSFIANGSAGGAAPQTIWFGAIPDRLNMLMPYNYPTARGIPNVPANYGNLWTPFNSSLGAFTTAPDGTTNVAQLLVEDSSNNVHYLQGGTFAGGGTASGIGSGASLGILRFAAFLKAGSRTRVGYLLSGYDGGGGLAQTITVVFDLAGGQVGVAAATGGGGSPTGVVAAEGTQMVPYPNGWYLCTQDVYWQDSGQTIIVAEIFLDSGSGTGGLSNSYAGNGSGGAYIWRTNMMPAASYGINNTILFDDFTSLSTIDVNNTKAPGFNWYVDGLWDDAIENNTNNPAPANKITQAGSILTLLPPGNASGACLGTASQINGPAGTFVGRGYGGGPAILYEIKMSWDQGTPPTDGNTLTWWSQSLEWTATAGTANPVDHAREFDMLEATGNSQTANPDTDTLYYTGATNANINAFSAGFGNGSYGFPPWLATFAYGGNSNNRVIQGGVVYSEVGSVSSLNNQPPNATYWTALTYPSGGVQPLLQPAVLTDFTQMHVYSTLVIPFWNQPGVSGSIAQQSTQYGTIATNGAVQDAAVGMKMQFFDGLFINMQSWGANLGGSYLANSDIQNQQLFMNPGTTNTMQVDYVKVMQ